MSAETRGHTLLENQLIGFCREIIRLHDAGVRPQIIRGGLREEQDWAEEIKYARTLIAELEQGSQP